MDLEGAKRILTLASAKILDIQNNANIPNNEEINLCKNNVKNALVKVEQKIKDKVNKSL